MSVMPQKYEELVTVFCGVTVGTLVALAIAIFATKGSTYRLVVLGLVLALAATGYEVLFFRDASVSVAGQGGAAGAKVAVGAVSTRAPHVLMRVAVILVLAGVAEILSARVAQSGAAGGTEAVDHA